MGKRKQEIPRKLGANEESAVSKLEKIVKKLRGNDDSIKPLEQNSKNLPKRQPLANRPSTMAEGPKSGPVFSAKPKPANVSTFVYTPADQQPLDLSLHKSVISNNKQPHLMSTTINIDRRVSSSQYPPRISPLVFPDADKDKEPINVMGSFQELSAKLEQYFATGIAAAKFPRKMVRGQDMWIQDVEQKRRILKCLKCGHSYNSLTELSAHIKNSGHHDNITVAPDASALRHCLKTSTVHVPVIKSPETKSAPVEQRIQATKPPRTYLPSSRISSRHEHDFLDQALLNGEPTARKLFNSKNSVSEFPVIGEERNGLLRRPSAFTPVIRQRPDIRPSETYVSTSPTSKSGQTFERKEYEKELSHRKNSSASVKKERPLEEDQSSVVPRKTEGSTIATCANQNDEFSTRDTSATDKIPVIEPSPLYALKRFLDFGIPRIRPNIIDGGRV